MAASRPSEAMSRETRRWKSGHGSVTGFAVHDLRRVRGRTGWQHAGERRKRSVEKSDGEGKQKNRRGPTAAHRGIHDDEEEEESEEQLDERRERFHRLVAALFPILALGLADAVFRRADEGGLVVEERLEHRLGVADGHPDAEREQQRQVGDFLPPRTGAQRLLGDQVEHDHRNRGEEEDRDVDDVVGELAEIRLRTAGSDKSGSTGR